MLEFFYSDTCKKANGNKDFTTMNLNGKIYALVHISTSRDRMPNFHSQMTQSDK